MINITNMFKSDLYKDIALVPHALTVSKSGEGKTVVSDRPDDFADKVAQDFMRIPASVRTRKHNKVYTLHKRFEDGDYFFEPAPSMMMALSMVRKGYRDCEGMMVVDHHEASHESFGLYIFERVKLAE